MAIDTVYPIFREYTIYRITFLRALNKDLHTASHHDMHMYMYFTICKILISETKQMQQLFRPRGTPPGAMMART